MESEGPPSGAWGQTHIFKTWVAQIRPPPSSSPAKAWVAPPAKKRCLHESESFKWGIGSVGGLDLQIWGAPLFPPTRVKRLLFKQFGENLGQKWAAPNLQIQPTNPIPHSLPSAQTVSKIPLLSVHLYVPSESEKILARKNVWGLSFQKILLHLHAVILGQLFLIRTRAFQKLIQSV